MVRENAGFSTTTADELVVLRRAASELADIGVDGIVIGFERNGEAALDDVARVLEAAPGVRATFHRAFEQLRDPLEGLDAIARVPQIDHILTSGGSGPALERSAHLAALSAHAGERLRIIAGGGLDEESLALFASTGCVGEVHVGRIAREGNAPDGPVSVELVKRLRRLADSSGLRQ